MAETQITNMQNCLVHHPVSTKLHCAPLKCMSVQNYIVNLDLHVRCQRQKYYTMHPCPCLPPVYVCCQHTWQKYLWTRYCAPVTHHVEVIALYCHLLEKCLLSVLVTHQIQTNSVCKMHVSCEPPKNEKCRGQPLLLTDIGPLVHHGACQWCTTQVSDAQHSPVPLKWCTT